MKRNALAFACVVVLAVAIAVSAVVHGASAPQALFGDDFPIILDEADDLQAPAAPVAPAADAADAAQSGSEPAYVEFDPDTVIVGLADGVSLDQVNAQIADLDYIATNAVSEDDVVFGFVQLDLADGVQVEDAVALLDAAPFADAAQPNYIYHLLDDYELPADPAAADPAAAAVEPVDIVGSAAEAVSAAISESPATPGSLAVPRNPATPDDPAAFTAQSTTVNDPDAASQWVLDAVNAYEAWDYVRASHSVTVAVLDSGANVSHEDLRDNIVGAYSVLKAKAGGDTGDVTDTKPNKASHGTHVTGIIAATANNGVGVAGVSYNAQVMPVQVIDSSGNVDSANAAAGINYIISYAQAHPEANVRVINMSFGGEYNVSDSVFERSSMYANDRQLRTAIEAATSAGMLSVCAAGNYADRYPHLGTGTEYADGVDRAYKCFPVDYVSSVVGVINADHVTTEDGTSYARAKGSNFNQTNSRTKDVVAPGTSIYSTTVEGYGNLSGTSMASPCVAGIAALVFAVDPSLTPAKAQQLLRDTAQDMSTEGFDLETGYGMVDAAAAVKKAGAPVVSGDKVVKMGSTTQLSAVSTLGARTWEWSSSNPDVATVDASGLVTGQSAGTATIRVQSGSIGASYEVSVYDPTIIGADTVEYGSRIQLGVSDANPAGSWSASSSDTSIIDMASGGLAYGRALGAAEITVSLTSPQVATPISSTKTVTVVPADLEGATLTGVEDQVYEEGKPATLDLQLSMPVYTLTWLGYTQTQKVLQEGTDYDIVYENNDAKGTATYTITGRGNFTGTRSGTFDIGDNTIGDSQVSASKVRYTYTGQPITVEGLVVKSADGTVLEEDVDYTVSYSDNIDVGDGRGRVTVEGIGKYVGEVTRTFYIDAVSIASEDVAFDESSIVDKTYTGSGVTQSPELTYNGMTLSEGTDFEVRYSNNTNTGTATMRIVGTATWNSYTSAYSGGNYYSTWSYNFWYGTYLSGDYRTATFAILPASLEDAAITVQAPTYTGSALTPVPAVVVGNRTLTSSDFTVTGYSDNVNAGTATVSIAAREGGNYTGSASGTFDIEPAPLASLELSTAAYTYDGAQKSPDVVVRGPGGAMLSEESYTLDVPDGRTDVGTYTYSATGRGNYAGTVQATLTISPAGTSGSGGEGGGSGGTGGGNSGNPGGTGGGGSDDSSDLAAYAGYALGCGFTDLDPSQWYLRTEEGAGAFPGTQTLYLDYTLARGLMSGYRDADGVMRRFGPNDALSRAQAATILYRLANPASTDTTDPAAYAANDSSLPDVQSGAYYTAAVNWCVQAGVITGYRNDAGVYYAFGPDDPVTREQIATMVARYCTAYCGRDAASADLGQFPDAGAISTWARDGVAYCVACGIVSGYSSTGEFAPGDLTQRCQMSKIIAVTARLLG